MLYLVSSHDVHFLLKEILLLTFLCNQEVYSAHTRTETMVENKVTYTVKRLLQVSNYSILRIHLRCRQKQLTLWHHLKQKGNICFHKRDAIKLYSP